MITTETFRGEEMFRKLYGVTSSHTFEGSVTFDFMRCRLIIMKHQFNGLAMPKNNVYTALTATTEVFIKKSNEYMYDRMNPSTETEHARSQNFLLLAHWPRQSYDNTYAYSDIWW